MDALEAALLQYCSASVQNIGWEEKRRQPRPTSLTSLQSGGQAVVVLVVVVMGRSRSNITLELTDSSIALLSLSLCKIGMSYEHTNTTDYSYSTAVERTKHHIEQLTIL